MQLTTFSTYEQCQHYEVDWPFASNIWATCQHNYTHECHDTEKQLKVNYTQYLFSVTGINDKIQGRQNKKSCSELTDRKDKIKKTIIIKI